MARCGRRCVRRSLEAFCSLLRGARVVSLFFVCDEFTLARWLAFTPQLCPVTCCPSRRGIEAQDWTMKQTLQNHVEMHATGLQEGQAPGRWLTDGSLHMCPVCPRLISTGTRPCCPRCHPALQQSRLPVHRTTFTSRHAKPGRCSLLLGPSQDSHLEGRPRGGGPLHSGRVDRSHLGQ